jgi:aldose 1-epimerase
MIRIGEFDGYKSFTIEKGEISLTVTEYGATATSLKFRGREMILGFDSIEGYEKSTAFIGAIVGRFANRIGGAAFTLNGERFALCANEGSNTLHGGDAGGSWHRRRWTGEAEGEDRVAFTLYSPDGDNGFPGALTATAEYRVTDCGVRIDFSGVSDRDTYYAPTSHIYFSLGEENILGAEMQINAPGHLEVDGGLIPTGRVLPVEGEFDFTAPRRSGRDYDDCFVLGGEKACTARAGDVKLTLYTDFPALQFYTGTWLDGGWARNAGFAIEPEFYPDTPNKPEFPDALLRAGTLFSKYLEFVFE